MARTPTAAREAIAVLGEGAVRRRNAKKFEILEIADISVDKLHPNPKNPRPVFHLGQDNPQIISLGESIRLDGLHRPLVVYEMLPMKPGHYQILQGHRRYEGALAARVMTLACQIVPRPENELRELEWLGNEDAYKEDWQTLYTMHYAWQVAAELGLDGCASREVSTKTGLTMQDLRIANRLFRLEPAIIGMVQQYEEAKYVQRLQSVNMRLNGRLMGHARAIEFTPEKAAVVWDIFSAMRRNCEPVVKKYSDLELQQSLANFAVKVGLEKLRKVFANINSIDPGAPKPGQMAQVDELLENPGSKSVINGFVRASNNSYLVRLERALRKIDAVVADVKTLAEHLDQTGTDPALHAQLNTKLLALLRHADRLQVKVEKKLRNG